MSDRLRILVLHRLGDPRTWRTSMVEHEFSLPQGAPEHDYVVHNSALPLPDLVRDIDFDGIVLCQTFLSRRRDPEAFRRTLEDYDFVRRSPALKIALPQDDYDCSAILDRWLCDWGVDVAYPVVSEHWDVLYPGFIKQGTLRLGYTGYLNARMRARWQRPKAASERRIDVSYRAAKLPPSFGRLGHLKGVIGEQFVAAAHGRGLVLDVSTDPKDTIVGSRWHEFLEDSRFVLGVNSGSSLWDPEGRINLRVYDYVVRHPSASFEEVEAACFPGEDGRYVFTAISPRNVECALIESAQVLTPGPYSGVLEEGVHYLPVAPDLSNADEWFGRMADRTGIARLVKACKEAVLSNVALRAEHHVAELIGSIAAAVRPGRASDAGQRTLIERYRSESRRFEALHWARKRAADSLRAALVPLGARRLKRMIVQLAGQR
jgi:hypothetical protein